MTIPNHSKWIVFGTAALAVLSWQAFLLFTKPESDSVSQEEKIAPLERGVVLRTNTWFSSLFFKFPTAPLFVFPGAYQLNERGLSMSNSGVLGTEKTIFGSFNPLCDITGPSPLTGVRVERYGDWDVVARVIAKDSPSWSVHFIQGSPVVDISDFPEAFSFSCKPGIVMSRYRNDTYLARQGEQSLFLVQAENPIADLETLRSSSGRYRIIQIPGETTQSFDFFLDLPWVTVLDTQYSTSNQNSLLHTELVTVTEDDKPVLSTLWPHHRLGGAEIQGEQFGSYQTVYGRLDLQLSNRIDTKVSDFTLARNFSPVSDVRKQEEVRSALREDAARYLSETPPSGVYFRGAWIGGLASIIQLADAYGMDEEEGKLLDLLERQLRISLVDFVYDEEKKMLVAGKNSEFGNEKGNDHHFHYGYYLRSAAVLFTARPGVGDDLRAVIDEMALDIANSDRSSERYPFLRHFSPYAGHSWADGEALFQDGNNQESSSEAMNAWYALYLWATVTDNSRLLKTATGLYANELLGLRSYWFGEGNSFPIGFEHPLVSLVWGGKRDYATWFSADPMHIQGIQWLPITPASEYLGALPNQPERMKDLGLNPSDAADHEWGDLYTVYLSYLDPIEAVKHLERASKHQAIKSKALLYHTVLKNLEEKR